MQGVGGFNQNTQRKQVMTINQRSDNKLKQLAQQEIVDFVYHHIRQMVREGKNIEIEGKLGRFFSKSKTNQDIEANNIRVNAIDTISHSSIVYLRPFEPILQFDSMVQSKMQQDQIKYFDMINKVLKGDESTQELKNFANHARVLDINCSETFDQEQNDITVDFAFEDGLRLKVPLNKDQAVVLDKKTKGAATNLDFVLMGQHYRISAREEEEITDQDKINEKLIDVKNKRFSSVRIKYRKAFKYLFLEFAFTRVFFFKKVTKNKMDASDILEKELFDEFANNVASKVLSREKFAHAGTLFFQRAFDLQYIQHTKFESELEMKNIKEYFGMFLTDANEYTEDSQMNVQSHIRAFIRNLVSLTHISDFFGQFYLQTIKITDPETSQTKPIHEYKPNILGDYFESL